MNTLKASITKWLLLLFLIFPCCTSTTDTITPNNPIRDGEVLVSSGQKSWALGFFSPGNSTRRYVGIWYYKDPEQTVVWVANRDRPINGTSGTLTINPKGNLVIYENNQSGDPVWSANVSASAANNYSVAQLLDTGNLVLLQQDSKRVLWQSFDHPTDSLLPFMKFGLDRRTGFIWSLSSWKSRDDPGTGDMFYRIDPSGYPQLFLYKGSLQWWRGGPWTGLRWSGVPEMNGNYIFRVHFVNNADEVTISYGINNVSNSPIFTRMTVNDSGYVQRSTWSDHDRRWIGFWSAPREQCDNYGECGANSNCDPYGDPDKFICDCLPGYEPRSPRDWYLRDGSRGCIRKSGSSTCRSKEGFVRLARVKLPDTSVTRVDMGLSLKQCGRGCLENCSCTAYASADERGSGCLMWFGDMVDTRTYSNVGQDIFVRVDAAELGGSIVVSYTTRSKAKYKKSKGPLAKRGVEAILIVSIALASFLILFLVYWFVKRKRKAGDEHVSTSAAYWGDSSIRKEYEESQTSTDLPLFDLSTIAAATSNFSTANKLGEGGFGAVYKGILHDGKEIAVKRLSKNSRQGVGEFKTEVALIAKLQHRNLVRTLGCCIENQEKMLVYEYLPNKSLDSVIFDETKRSQLDWPMRFNIICGVARGILYLHQDSRLRIIHRDLKASNVLLDASMNAKISDFGMARIVGVDQIEETTRRIVGTYGYMSPEYAMQGLFSVKSDVYSFGVLLLEIMTGHKNSTFYDESSSSNLVGYVWERWREGRAMETVDLSLAGAYPEQEVLKCIQIGLLCVQESAVDRPTMSTVIFMLSNDTILPTPRRPAFILRGNYNSKDPSTSGGANTVNDVTVTLLEAR